MKKPALRQVYENLKLKMQSVVLKIYFLKKKFSEMEINDRIKHEK